MREEEEYQYKYKKRKEKQQQQPKRPKRKVYHKHYTKRKRKVFCAKTVDEDTNEEELLRVMKQNKWYISEEILSENNEHIIVFFRYE